MHEPEYPDSGASAATARGRSAASEIATGMVQLTSRYSGRGPTKARTTMNTNVVLVILEEMLTRAEQSLAAAGDAHAVTEMRKTLQSMMHDEAIELVERTTGRTVRAYLSTTDPVNNIGAEVFVLDSQPETGLPFIAEAEIG